ncbi:MAG: MarR family winged helix-turn-helix transcriptional regulator [Desulfobacterales bacterium]|nr:MarR family winged helix-turn-helix transcriptional regulator [Desulfobacterales bacterium]
MNQDQKIKIDTIVSQCLSVRVRLINRMVSAIYDKAMKPHGIKSTQFTVLAAVAALESPTSRELSQVLHMDTSTFSRTLGILKQRGLLESEPSGQGKILTIRITRDGAALLEQAYPDWEKAQAEALDALGPDTFDRIVATGSQFLYQGLGS